MNLENVQIVNSQPPEEIYMLCRDRFGANFERGTVFTVGETIHTRYSLPPDLLTHELVHVYQQKNYPGGPDAWWNKYLSDDTFRLDQELEAYREQYKYILKNEKDRNKREKLMFNLAKDLSGNLYGNLVRSINEARKLIKTNI